MDPSFKLPIEYIEKKHKINKNIQGDLELVTYDQSGVRLYNKLLGCESKYYDLNQDSWVEYFTSDIEFLEDTQLLLQDNSFPKYIDCNETLNIYNETNNKDKDAFHHKYDYIDYDTLKPLNENTQFLQFFSLYNISSPIISFITPIIFIIMPFFLMKLQGHSLNIKNYVDVLLKILKNHSIGKLFTMDSDLPLSKKIYIVISFGFYIFQIYQNILFSKRFIDNMKHIHSHLFTIRDFIKNSIANMDSIHLMNYSSYKPFIEDMMRYKNKLEIIGDELLNISEPKVSIDKMLQIGHVMKIFYKMYMNPLYKETIQYAIYFNGYILNMNTFQDKIQDKKINKCKFTNTMDFTKSYFAEYENEDNVKNTYNFKKNMLITGPNASGKTTILKSTLFNIILSQQIGYGYYSEANINPYQHIHSYINIPDTSGRDSLFQSEARRCKNILDDIKKYNNDRHFCIFDELFSGTNPIEATASSYGFLSHIKKYKNVNCMITTHFVKLCKLLKKEVDMRYMDSQNNETGIEYTYKMKKGVNHINGGIQILKDMDFPKDMIDYTLKIKK